MKEIEKGGGMLVEREKIHVKRQESASFWERQNTVWRGYRARAEALWFIGPDMRIR